MGSSLSKSHLPRNYWPGETGQVKPTRPWRSSRVAARQWPRATPYPN